VEGRPEWQISEEQRASAQAVVEVEERGVGLSPAGGVVSDDEDVCVPLG
jgi:hypothetical protein